MGHYYAIHCDSLGIDASLKTRSQGEALALALTMLQDSATKQQLRVTEGQTHTLRIEPETGMDCPVAITISGINGRISEWDGDRRANWKHYEAMQQRAANQEGQP